MARSRTIKPGFFTNEDLVEIEPLGRLLFIGLWTLADREGRLVDRPRKIKMNLLPCDNCDADALLQDLANAGFIIRYEVNGERYIQISNFTKHQNIHPKEVKSNLPPIPGQETDEQVGGRGKQLASQSIPSFPSIPSRENTLSGKPDGASQIIDYLNKRIGASYRSSTKKTKALIKARQAEGFVYQDFVNVIDKKAEEWLGTDMQQYLRPETLFGTKFESYLNQKISRSRDDPENNGLDWL